ncbi:antizyme inhibitor 2 isoform X3 [Mustela lutreola]|uniref:antizyme inhibitor 2 isoform X3 n=1 Tax=Mustela lutreola TaxID=9666 RepID=UPI002797854A|nr:antizyme inhibitor 2 isoform X3 [Mustela lutreola]
MRFKCVAYFLRRRGGGAAAPSSPKRLLLLGMAGYLSETDFVMVEEGFSTRDLLEELTLGASQATAGDVAAFFVADLGAVVRKHFCFLKCLPRVRPFYTVKCNSSPGVLKVLAELGLGFSCANKAEMELVQRIGVPASKIIYANPCKQIAQIKYAAKHGVRLLSFDNEMELAKVVKGYPSARMVLGIATDDRHSLSPLSFKFGASLQSCRHLLENAKRSHVEVVGVSFHVGSGCPDLHAYAQSIADARLVFEMGAELGHRMHLLDLGGGFPGLEGAKVRFEEIASVINSALDLYFPEGCGVDILARLGRYYVTSAFTLAVSIIAKKEVLLDQPVREGKRFEGSCCLQSRMRTPRACASLCPVAGRSQTPCAWALSSPRRASCERTPFPPPRELQRGCRDASGRREESSKQGHPLARTLVLALLPPTLRL